MPQEDLTDESTKKILDAFAKGQKPKPGPQSGRHTSENSAGLTALTSKVRSFKISLVPLLIQISLHSPMVLESTVHRNSPSFVSYGLA